MGAIVKLSPQTRAGSYLGLTKEQFDQVKVSHNYLFVEVPVGAVEGAIDGVIKANSRVTLEPRVPFNIKNYNALIGVAPVFAERGIAQFPLILSPGEGEGFKVTFNATKQLKVEDIPYLLRIYFID